MRTLKTTLSLVLLSAVLLLTLTTRSAPSAAHADNYGPAPTTTAPVVTWVQVSDIAPSGGTVIGPLTGTVNAPVGTEVDFRFFIQYNTAMTTTPQVSYDLSALQPDGTTWAPIGSMYSGTSCTCGTNFTLINGKATTVQLVSSTSAYSNTSLGLRGLNAGTYLVHALAQDGLGTTLFSQQGTFTVSGPVPPTPTETPTVTRIPTATVTGTPPTSVPTATSTPTVPVPSVTATPIMTSVPPTAFVSTSTAVPPTATSVPPVVAPTMVPTAAPTAAPVILNLVVPPTATLAPPAPMVIAVTATTVPTATRVPTATPTPAYSFVLPKGWTLHRATTTVAQSKDHWAQVQVRLVPRASLGHCTATRVEKTLRGLRCGHRVGLPSRSGHTVLLITMLRRPRATARDWRQAHAFVSSLKVRLA